MKETSILRGMMILKIPEKSQFFVSIKLRLIFFNRVDLIKIKKLVLYVFFLSSSPEKVLFKLKLDAFVYLFF